MCVCVCVCVCLYAYGYNPFVSVRLIFSAFVKELATDLHYTYNNQFLYVMIALPLTIPFFLIFNVFL